MRVTTFANGPEREAGDSCNCVRAGQIELMANYLHFTDLIDPERLRPKPDMGRSIIAAAMILAAALRYALRHQRLALGAARICWPTWYSVFLPARCISTVPPTRLAVACVHYHWLREWGLNALRPDTPIWVPQAGSGGPHGGKVLHWLNEHYHLGNVLGSPARTRSAPIRPGLLPGDRTYSPADDLYAVARREVPMYLDLAARRGLSLYHDAAQAPAAFLWTTSAARRSLVKEYRPLERCLARTTSLCARPH